MGAGTSSVRTTVASTNTAISIATSIILMNVMPDAETSASSRRCRVVLTSKTARQGGGAMAVDARARGREDRDAELDRVRRAARHRRTAALLEGWARGSANRAVADLVLERAAERRSAADRADGRRPTAD
jgi:hypothetical protein